MRHTGSDYNNYFFITIPRTVEHYLIRSRNKMCFNWGHLNSAVSLLRAYFRFHSVGTPSENIGLDLQNVVGDQFRILSCRYLEAFTNTKDVIGKGHRDPCSRIQIEDIERYSLQGLDDQAHPTPPPAFHHRYHHPTRLTVDPCLLTLRR